MKIQNSKLKIIFAGTPEIGAQLFEHLINSKIDFDGCITRPDKPKGRGKEMAESPVKITAKKYDVPVHQPANKLELIDLMINLKPDLVIVAAYGMIIPKAALEIPKYGMINFHPSLLPLYRGPSPITATTLAGDKKTGVSIMKISEGVDDGDIYKQEILGLDGTETTPELSEKLVKVGAKIIKDILPRLIKNDLTPKPQDDKFATYTKMIKKEDGKIDWLKMTAVEIERMSRAYTPWPGIYSYWNDKKIDLYDISISTGLDPDQGPTLTGGSVAVSDGKLFIATKSGFIYPTSIKLEGKNKITAEEFLRGYPEFESAVLK